MHEHSRGAAAVVGYLVVVAFALVYLAALPLGWQNRFRAYWSLFALTLALLVAECFFAHEDALVFGVYIAVLAVAAHRRIAFLFVAALVAAALLLPAVVPGWGGEPDWNNGLTIALVSVAMWGFFAIIRGNIALAQARAEVARLAAETERSRIARDLHDLLGHSLTTITVKAALARRLADLDPARAAAEIAEVEELSRRSLADVRAAVAGYRDVSLAGELASGREVLRAAGIDAVFPGAVDVVDPRYAELFGWAVREAVTNVVRHSRAGRCTITLGPDWIEVVDDGRGSAAGSGSGLAGLRERAAAVGATVSAGGTGAGWRVRVEMPAAQAAVEPGRSVGRAAPAAAT